MSSYDEVAYIGRPFALTHPDQLAVQARVRGASAPDVATARVMEIGCGDGGNLVPMAGELPNAQFVGIDLSASAIDAARAYADEAGLTNIRFECADLAQLDGEHLGAFDYVIAHGVYSWVPGPVRTALLALIRDVLTTDGIAYVSYNAYPGSHLRDMAAEVLQLHAEYADVEALGAMGAARELMQLVVDAAVPGREAQIMAEQMRQLLDRPDWLTYHDELGAFSSPFYFHEFVAHAGAHGLTFLNEAHEADAQLLGCAPGVAATLAGVADPLLREQYGDVVRNRAFRRTLLRRAGASNALHDADAANLDDLWLAAPVERIDDSQFALLDGVRISTDDPRLIAAFDVLGGAWPTSVRLHDVCREDERDELARAMLALHATRAVELRTSPSRAVRDVSDAPLAPAAARARARAGRSEVANARHAPIDLTDERARALLALLDGTRTIDDLAAAFDDAGGGDASTRIRLAAALDQLAQLGLLVG